MRLPAEKKSKPNPDVEALFCQDLEPVDEDDLLGFQPEEPDPRVAESAACTPPVPVSSLACFPSQLLLGDTKHYDSIAEVQPKPWRSTEAASPARPGCKVPRHDVMCDGCEGLFCVCGSQCRGHTHTSHEEPHTHIPHMGGHTQTPHEKPRTYNSHEE